MRKLYLAAGLGFSLSCFAACFPSLAGFTDATGVGGAGAGGSGTGAHDPSGGGSTSTTLTGTAGASGSGGDAMPPGPCDLTASQKGALGIPNPGMHVVDRCIATTETSWGEYDEFLGWAGFYGGPVQAVDPSIADVCGWKNAAGANAFKPIDYDDWHVETPADDGKPVQGVDWCDAWMYCFYAGKELCGAAPSGGPVDRNPEDWDQKTEWYQACFANKNPNTDDCYPADPAGNDIDKTSDAGSACVGKGGIHHMLSNVWEWEDNCIKAGGTGEDDDCRFRGQTNRTPDGIPADCAWPNPGTLSPRKSDGYHVGIRCCWDQKGK